MGNSDRIGTKRRLYRDSSRKDRNGSPGVVKESVSDDEDEESLERKIARLRKEVVEVKGEIDRRKTEDDRSISAAAHDEDDPLDALNKILNGASAATSESAPTQMVKKLGAAIRTSSTSNDISEIEPLQQNRENSSYTVTYAPSFQQNHTLSKVADFDARLTLIENVLGTDVLSLPAQERLATKAIFPTLDNLDRQLFTISSVTDSSLDSVNRKVKQLTQDAQKLGEARTSAKAAQDALHGNSALHKKSQSVSNEIKRLGEIEDPEQNLKIDALYGTLATIESLAPLLPSVLDRLRSLQAVHADATNASENLSKLEARQEAMVEDLKGWRDGLEKVEGALKEGEQKMTVNVKQMETIVKDLERRMQSLSN